MKKIKLLIIKVREYFSGKNLSISFLKLYIFGLGVGIILYLAYAFGPFLVTCSTLSKTDFCTPTGIFIMLAFSFPGYLAVGEIFNNFPRIPWGISFLIVILASAYIYYLVGLLVYKIKVREIKSYIKTPNFIISILIFLIILFFNLT